MEVANDHEKMCLLAYEFRNSPASSILAEKLQNRRFSALWLRIRHLIGRLGSWWKACKAVTRGARHYPSRLERFEVFPVPSSKVSISPPKVFSEVNLPDALKRLFPTYSDDQLQHFLQDLRHGCGFDVDETFVGKFMHKNFRPRLHAEVFVMDHFHHYRLSFVGDDRYIGCSKPSCYCCNLYNKFHPGSYLPRPCHGNTWINWCTPAHLNMQIALNRDDTNDMINRMLEQIRRDITLQFTGSDVRSRLFDSATGLSASVAVTL